MPLRKVFRTVAVSVACAVAAIGLCYQSFATSAGSGSIDQDFIVLSQTAGQGLDRQLIASNDQPQTLADWEFTARVRPIKCRFVD